MNSSSAMQTSSSREKKSLLIFLSTLVSVVFIFVIVSAYFSKSISDRFAAFRYQSVRYLQDRVANSSEIQIAEDALVLGDSTAARNLFVGHWIGLRSSSLAVMGGSLIDSDLLMRAYLKSNKPPKCVVIMTSYGAIGSHFKTYFWETMVQSGFYSFESLVELYDISQMFGEYPSDSYSRVSYLKKILFDHNSIWIDFGLLQAAIWDSDTERSARRAMRSLIRARGASPQSREAAGRARKKFFDDNHEFLNHKFKEERTLDSYIHDLLRLLVNHKVQVLVVAPPMAESARTPTAEAWLKDYTAHLRPILSEYPNVKGLLETKWLPATNFSDINHLVDTAAAKFSIELRPEIDACVQRAQNDH